jgi:S1-C subfamily serine protease
VWALVTWRDSDSRQAYKLGQYLGPKAADCDGFTGTQLRLNVDLPTETLGGAVFDADGGLMGVIADCSGAVAALDAATVEAALAAPQRIEDHLAGRFGLAVSAVSEDERERLGVGAGVLIRQVWRGYQADAAELLPGDLILGLDSRPVSGVGDLEVMTLPAAREAFDLAVLRVGRQRVVRVSTKAQGHRFGLAGVAWKRPLPGLAIAALDPNGRLAQAGAQPGDRLLQIDGRTAENEDEIDRILAQPKRQVYAVFERNGRLWGALL